MIRSINVFRALALCAGLIPAAALAQDNNESPAGGTAPRTTTLAAGGLFGGNPKSSATCFLYNAGRSAVSFSGAEIVDRNGPVKLLFNNCNVPLAAGSICQFNANISRFEVLGCKVVVSPDSKLVRVIFEIETIVGNTIVVLTNVELR